MRADLCVNISQGKTLTWARQTGLEVHLVNLKEEKNKIKIETTKWRAKQSHVVSIKEM